MNAVPHPRQPLLSEISRNKKWALLARHLPVASKVLEIGPGDGWFTDRLRSAGHYVTTIDLHPPADVIGDVQDWRTLPLDAGSFDVVVALEVIEHVDCVAAIEGLCKPHGLIFLSSPHPQWDWVMKILETMRLTQKRTSPHNNLVDFLTLPWLPIRVDRPAGIHQIGLFLNSHRNTTG
ncbi:MAG: class I SAM-dependent methyltransferase [Candidatus Sericytochromatia bacterium]|nr:class I SAM-dependent methyltransferase [Candidatus Sericytochromatia bacterium]